MSHRVDDAGDVSEMVGGEWMHRRATGRLKGDNAVIIAASAGRVSPRRVGRAAAVPNNTNVAS